MGFGAQHHCGSDIVFLARVLIAVGIAQPNHIAVLAVCVHLCLVVCDHRARLSVRHHQHGHY